MYHVFEDINYMEVVDESGNPTSGLGLLVGTNLHNFAMPMIRYAQNDRGSIAYGSCTCGRTFAHLANLQGRANDSFTMPSGRTLSSGFLLDAAYDVVLSFRTAVLEFCLVQETASDIVLEVVPGQGWSADVQRQLVERFTSYFEPGVAFRIDTVTECRRTKSGKRNPIINLMRRSAGLTHHH